MRVIVALAVLFMSFTVLPAQAARLEAKIDISQQKMRVYKNGRLLYVWPVSTGKRGYRTPTGSYSPKRMHREYYSRKYDGSPMPYSIFFHRGYAIHGTNSVKRLGRPASHGCVRLAPSHARKLFNMTRSVGPRNMRVRIRY